MTRHPRMKTKGSMTVAELRHALYRERPALGQQRQERATLDLRPMPPEQRPQDPYLDGRDMRFAGYQIETLEQGGEYPDTMPQVIEATDASGRKAVYVPFSRNGTVLQSNGLIDALKRCGLIERKVR
ncbi:hypothetical protein BRAO375_2560032 [Bradyrhizobium sp. ORS 375]|uniref:hypothetical protein n=1 Tax=Bradyrhizobium sp. (strain ORS 375) TaxID=566679 RepID=UPI0002409682|nr:hypothetical protein [Bradyrhizobium sp. ORS 375]CCD93363.1 hypothetical protein BRAO375_2560032 [Bradyrhizobium sp. ORS 375]